MSIISTAAFEMRWKQLEEELAARFGKTPDMEAILFLIGINEYRGSMPAKSFSKEQKEDLMHIAVCTLLEPLGYYKSLGYDKDGWPQFEKVEEVKDATTEGQEHLLKECILHYMD